LKEHQAGMTAAELCRKHGISDATFYKWRKKYGGMEVSDAKRLKALEEENAKLKKLLAEQMMDVSTLREMLEKTSDARLEEERRELGHRREGLLAAAGLCPGWHRSACLPLPVDAAGRCRLRQRLRELSSERRRFGYRRLHICC
jgi:putative transposase